MSRLDYGGDSYSELASIRANTQASVAFQALQTGLLADMSNSMNAVHAQMEAVRQQQSEALAIQQELLNREQLQSYIEEFVFQAEKLVVECSKTTTDIPASSRYFLLMGVLGKIEDDGIGTPIIKGRDNKAAFEKVVTNTKGLTQRLLKDPEVQEAIKWADAEKKRLEAERVQAERERKANIQKLEKQLDTLRMQLRTVPFMDQAKLEWDNQISLFDKHVLSRFPALKTPFIILGVLFFPLFIGAISILLIKCYFKANQRTNELNADVNIEIESVNNQIAELKSLV